MPSSRQNPEANRQPLMVDGAPLALMTGEELARAMDYKGVTSGFRAWCRKLNITPVPGRANVYDPKLVRIRLDASQGIESAPSREPSSEQAESLVEKRRKRRA